MYSPYLKKQARYAVIILFLLLGGCDSFNRSYRASTIYTSYVVLGSAASQQTWLYLCGLVVDFVPANMDELRIIDEIGKELDIKFIAIAPTQRCAQLNNKLCWPHNNKQETLETYRTIMQCIRDQEIQGYIGFSNGGFFLTMLAQCVPLESPIIAIGAGGSILNVNGPDNTITLLIGKNDQWHYESALAFYKQSKDTNLKVNFIEYEQGHELPITILKNCLSKA